jgi:hypothetical protein
MDWGGYSPTTQMGMFKELEQEFKYNFNAYEYEEVDAEEDEQ